jgi:hypothetical protein
MVCGSPPEGCARWTVRLVAEEAVKRKLVPRAGRETVRILLLRHDLKLWREKMWVVADLDDNYIVRRARNDVVFHGQQRLFAIKCGAPKSNTSFDSGGIWPSGFYPSFFRVCEGHSKSRALF